MLIDSIRVKNFRSIADETLSCEQLTVLVSANGSGKSSFLRAFELFYDAAPKVSWDDFYNGETSEEIVVAITFKNLSDEAKNKFAIYLQNDKLTVERVITWEEGKTTAKYHGASLQNPEFNSIREAQKASDKKLAYEALRKKHEYSNLPAWSNQNAAIDNIRAWEESHPNNCVRQRDDGQFFGFKEVAQGYLGRYTRFLLIPAVREASSDASEGRGSVLTEFMDLVVRSTLANKEAVLKLQEETQTKYEEILDPSKLTELNELKTQLTRTLKTYVPDASVDLIWRQLEQITIPLPKADAKLVEDGYSSAVALTGHGLQRAFILTMLQHLALAQASSETHIKEGNTTQELKTDQKLPNLILAIEEPELYQHPNRQRHLAKIFLQLASGKTPGVAESTQILYSTHSPLFVGLDRIEQIRLLRKVISEPEKPKVTKIISTTLDRVAKEIWKANGEVGEEYTGKSLLPRLHTIMTPWTSEGFFAEIAVLVEGEDDRAAILGTASAMGYDLESLGISVIPCGGKTCLDRPAVIFRQLGIRIYVIWDGDKGDKEAKPQDNHRLLRLMGKAAVDWPSEVDDSFACFENKLEATLNAELGQEFFLSCLCSCQMEFDIPEKNHAMKNPSVISNIMQTAKENGKNSKTLEEIVNRIRALRSRSEA